jgi:ribosomal protein S18 acetylase RimI-like enzyme
MHLVPAYRNRGLGSELVRELQQQAGWQGKAVLLHVMKINPAARALYERLGFAVTGEDARRYRMRWRPDAAARPADGA